MTQHTQPHTPRTFASSATHLAWLAALDLSVDDIVRPELRNSAIPAGHAHRGESTAEHAPASLRAGEA